ncbi:MAG: Dynein light chain [Lichina confinis]|nr:MAG: Dynein light chain [Lichina confinis]
MSLEKEKLEAQIKSSDMSEELQQEAVEAATEAMTTYNIEKVSQVGIHWTTDVGSNCSTEQDIAQYIKKEFDAKKGATWHCIVGRNFGSFVTHESKHFIYFYLGHNAILLFKTQ